MLLKSQRFLGHTLGEVPAPLPRGGLAWGMQAASERQGPILGFGQETEEHPGRTARSPVSPFGLVSVPHT